MNALRGFLEGEVGYVAVLFALTVVPRLLLPLRVPAAITALGLGALAVNGLALFDHDDTIRVLATFGIVSLFLLAGLEVEFAELRRGARVIIAYVAFGVALTIGMAMLLAAVLQLEARAALLTSLALVTPSTGFILDSLPRYGLTAEETFWVKAKAIANEMIALLVLFVVMQSNSARQLAISSAALLAMLALIPLAFAAFARYLAPRAPNSEFAFLLLVAVICALGTKALGVYYLVGAFVTGMAARLARRRMPALSSTAMLHSLELFASVFVPFYFFKAGAGLAPADFSRDALLLGAAFVVVALPLRVVVPMLQRRFQLGEPPGASWRVSLPLLPTLVFTLVIAGILRDQFAASPTLFGALVIYTLASTTLPGLIAGSATPTPGAARDADDGARPITDGARDGG
ncbi:MAG: cation:proton antiporter [Gemmatimonadetes bacterium]|nr:cation:proton antiporter [Gemmatimonadota bacterium]